MTPRPSSSSPCRRTRWPRWSRPSSPRIRMRWSPMSRASRSGILAELVESGRRRLALPRLAPDGRARARGSGLGSRRPVPRPPVGHHRRTTATTPEQVPPLEDLALDLGATPVQHDARRARPRRRARLARAAARRLAARRPAAPGERRLGRPRRAGPARHDPDRRQQPRALGADPRGERRPGRRGAARATATTSTA